MTREQLLQRLQIFQGRAAAALRLLESTSLTEESKEAVRRLAGDLRQELGDEYDRVISPRAQRSMTMFELSVYVLCIEDAWTKSKIKRLKLEKSPDATWSDSLEAILYHLSKSETDPQTS